MGKGILYTAPDGTQYTIDKIHVDRKKSEVKLILRDENERVLTITKSFDEITTDIAALVSSK